MRRLAALTLICLLAAGCGPKGGEWSATSASPTPSSPSPTAAQYAGTDEGATKLLTDIRGGDAATLTRSLKPTSADYAAVFEGGIAARAEQAYARSLWNDDPANVIAGKPEQTQLKIWKATTEEIKTKAPVFRENFPSGYNEIAPHLKAGLTIYRWKYVKPGEELGTAYDGLIFVNGHWTWYPKPWRVLGVN